jgi:hypothetical protein
MYADRTAIPYVTTALLDKCVTSELGRKLREERRVSATTTWRTRTTATG